MAKWLLLAVVLVLALWWLRRSRGGSGRSAGSADGSPSAKTGGSDRRAEAGRPGAAGQAGSAPVEMVSCAHCGVYLPVTDAVTDAATAPGAEAQSARHYCSAEHRKAGPGRTP